jgi:hypothetical protein
VTPRIVDALAAAALVAVTARTLLLDVPEPFWGASRFGELVSNLALAYIAAWIFNLLVVEIPRIQNEAAIHDALESLVRQAAGHASAIIRNMEQEAQKLVPSVDAENIALLCATLHPGGQAPLILGVNADGSYRNATWKEYLRYESHRAEQVHERLIPGYLYFDAALIALLLDAKQSSFLYVVRQFSALPLSNDNLSFVANSLREYDDKCNAIQSYWDALGPPSRSSP